MKKILLIFIVLLSGSSLQAAKLQKTLYLTAGFFVGTDGGKAPAISFSEDSAYRQRPLLLLATAGDSFVCRITNLDTLPHDLLWAEEKAMLRLKPGESLTLRKLLPSAGIFPLRARSDATIGYPATTGLAASVHVLPAGTKAKTFHWQLASWDTAAMRLLRDGKLYPRFKLNPIYHTINSFGYSDTEKDSSAKIRGRVGDTLLLFMYNAGFAAHAVHFHGFHGEVISSRAGNTKMGWKKDTFPLEAEEWTLIQLIPDKPGIYPVHDHNLLGNVGGGIYPNGMMIHMNIVP